jgi:alkylation response protein AidB-like acyl-CoA dehydrogenase
MTDVTAEPRLPSFLMTEEHTLLIESVRRMLRSVQSNATLRAVRDVPDTIGYSQSAWATFADGGFAGLIIPESYGGAGLGHVQVCGVSQELGRYLTPMPFLCSAVVAATGILAVGTEEQKKRLLPKISAGGLVVALALDERSEHNADLIETTVARSEAGLVLNGLKRFVINGAGAQQLIVVARDDRGAVGGNVTLVLVDAARPGVVIERVRLLDGTLSATVRFTNVRVSPDEVLGDLGNGKAALQRMLLAGCTAVAGELLGVADACFDATLSYLRERRQFGRLIGEFQALQHRAAHLYTELEITRAAVMKAASLLDGWEGNLVEAVAVAKARAALTAELAVQEGVQIHGGMGMTDDIDIGIFMKRARVLTELYGDADFHVNRIAELNGY